MKKYLLLIMFFIAGLTLTGCDLFSGGTTTTKDNLTTNTTTDTTTTSTNNSTTETTTISSSSSSTTTTTSKEDVIYMELNSGIDTVEINSFWTDTGANLVVNDTEYNMTTIDTVDITTLGLYQINYTYIYEDTGYSITRYVIVEDQTAPLLTLNLGVDTVKLFDTWTDAGVIISDNSGEILTAAITGSVDTANAGTYQIIYSATDSCGNTSSVIRYVTVIE